MGSVEQTMKNFLYSLFIGLFGIAALTSIAFLLMYAAQSKQQAHLYSDLAAVRKQDTQQETASEPEKQASYQNLYWENTDMVGWILIEDTKGRTYRENLYLPYEPDQWSGTASDFLFQAADAVQGQCHCNRVRPESESARLPHGHDN